MSPLVRSATIAKYSSVARHLGIDPLRIVNQVGLDQACLTTPDLRVPEASLAALLEISSRSAEGASMGLLIGETWRLADFGVISLLLQHQPTLRQALAKLHLYRHLISDSVVVDLSEHGAIAVIEVRLVTGRPQPGRQPVELALGAALSLCRFVLGQQWMPRSVHFSHPAPASVLNHRRVFGPRLEFGAEFDGIVLARDDLDRVNPASDATMERYAQDYIDLQPRSGPRSAVQDVRRMVHVLLPRGRSGIEQVSQSLQMNPRTLQRQLEQEGTTFLSVVNEVRRELAIRFLENEAYSVSQVADLLGFAQISAFSRWFSQQFGQSPSRWGKG